MSDEHDSSLHAGRVARRRRRWIRGLVLLAITGMGAALLLRLVSEQLSHNGVAMMEPAIANMVGIAVCLLTWTGALIWVVLLSGWRWSSRGLAAVGLGLLVALPLVLYEPVLSGSLWPRRWRPRFWSAPVAWRASHGSADLSPESAVDFPQFLGPRRDGTVDSVRLDPDWSAHPPRRLWAVRVGPAWSGVAARNGYAVTMEQRGELECVTCYQVEDGEPVWTYSHRRRHEHPLGGVGPRSTPTIAGGRVYALGATGILLCLDGRDGRCVWQADLLSLGGVASTVRANARGELVTYEQSNVTWGRSASPLVERGRVIVPLGGSQTLIAFDAADGREVWRGGTQPIGYGSPIAATLAGREQILLVSEADVAGFAAETGELLWSSPRPGSSSADANTSQVNRCDAQSILVTKGYGLGGERLRLEPTADGTLSAVSLWKSNRVLKTKLTSPVLRDGFAYALSNEILECVDLADGARRWRAPIRFGHGQLLAVGGLLLVHSERGQLSLVAAEPTEFRELGSISTIEGVCWNTLCLVGQRLIVRSDLEMACFELPLEL